MGLYRVTFFNREASRHYEKSHDYYDAETIEEANEIARSSELAKNGWGILKTEKVNAEYGYLTEQQIEAVKERMNYLIGLIITDHCERGDVVYELLKEVCEDIGDNAGWSNLYEDEWCDADIDIAVSRAFYNRIFPNGA